ncbi:hypothetical protein [Campylobacter sp.]|uniref:hypothetical protein n=1 Tax=Campylobacter sp. TaxID=205 RepID=UPI00270D27BE|nr:hypothetical protein [Campylobacter sp.]
MFALYGVINFTQISKTTLYLVSLLGFIAIIYSLIMWLKIHYNLAKITENKIFKIYATSSIIALILITIAAVSIPSIIFFTYFENPNELILMQLKMQTYIIILNYITMLVLNFILLFAWTKAKDINLQKIAE